MKCHCPHWDGLSTPVPCGVLEQLEIRADGRSLAGCGASLTREQIGNTERVEVSRCKGRDGRGALRCWLAPVVSEWGLNGFVFTSTHRTDKGDSMNDTLRNPEPRGAVDYGELKEFIVGELKRLYDRIELSHDRLDKLQDRLRVKFESIDTSLSSTRQRDVSRDGAENDTR